MNDRVSAAPPVHFIGPDHVDVGTWDAEGHWSADGMPDWSEDTIRAVADVQQRERQQAELHRNSHNYNQRVYACPPPARQPPAIPQQPGQRPNSRPQSQEHRAPSKRGSKQFLGQVWDGVSRVFGFGGGGSSASSNASKRSSVASSLDQTPTPPIPGPAAAPAPGGHPSREEVLANYHHLVASGFFSQHAIQSTRHAAPGTRPQQQPQQRQPQQQAPSWPLREPQDQPATPQKPPAPEHEHEHSPPSRGVKRAARGSNDSQRSNDPPSHKVRKTAATTTRELAVPRARASPTSAPARPSHRSTSGTARPRPSGPRHPAQHAAWHAQRAHLAQQSAVRRASGRISTRTLSGSLSKRVISGPVRAERLEGAALRVRPDGNSVPDVPAVPGKYVDDENRRVGVA